MFELYKNEIKRLKLWIFIPALVYLMLTSASIYFGEYADSGNMIGSVHSIFFAIVALLLGLVMIHSHKKGSRWVYLINRPASNTSLCLTLIAAGATIVFFQGALIDLLITLTMDNLSHYVIEQRHYYQVFYIFFVSMGFYLTGVFIKLCHSKGAFLVAVLPILTIASMLLGGSAIVVSLLVVLWLVFLVLSVFKANINNNHTPLWGKILAIIPFQLGLFLIIGMFFTFSMQMKNLLIDGAGIDIPWNEYFADDTYHHVIYLEGYEKLMLSIQEADDSIQQQYNSQLKNINTVAISPEIELYHSKGLLPYQQNIQQLTIEDSSNEVQWVFSFDQMVFLGKTSGSKDYKKLGIPSEDNSIKAFESIPTVTVHSGRTQVVTKQQIYFYDADFQKLNLRISVANDETLLSGLYHTGAFMGLISTKNIYLFNSNSVHYSSGLLIPVSVVEIPGAHENLSQVELAEMIDSTLVSLLFGKNSTTGLYPAEQMVIEIDSSTNQVRTLATRPLKHGFSEAYYHLGLLISPLTNWYYQQLIKPNLKADSIKPLSPNAQVKLSTSFMWLILFLSLSAIFLTFWYSKNRSKSNTERWSWVFLSCLTGTMGFLVFLLLSDKNSKLKQMKIKENP